jgi:hypothetical protein
MLKKWPSPAALTCFHSCLKIFMQNKQKNIFTIKILTNYLVKVNIAIENLTILIKMKNLHNLKT